MTEPRRPTRFVDPSTDELHAAPVGDTPSAFLLNGVPPLEEGPDPFDPEALRLPQDFTVALGVQTVLTHVPVRKPAKEWFIRVHPDPAYQLQTAVIELKEEQEVYLVRPELWPYLVSESTFTYKKFFTAMNRQGVLFLWALRLPSTEGRRDNWSTSALEAAHLAMSRWVRVQADVTLGAYRVQTSEHAVEPTWPSESLGELLRIAFRDRYIDALEHTILRQLRGEV